MRRHTAPAAAAAILTATILCTGCTPATPNTPTPFTTATPTPRTPTSPTPTESSSAELFAEAGRVYRAQSQAILRYQGTRPTPPPSIKEWTTGVYYLDLLALFKKTYESRARYVGGQEPVWTITLNTSDGVMDSEVTIDVCGDGSKTHYERDGKRIWGVIYTATAYLKTENGRLKVFRQENQKRVSKCPF